MLRLFKNLGSCKVTFDSPVATRGDLCSGVVSLNMNYPLTIERFHVNIATSERIYYRFNSKSTYFKIHNLPDVPCEVLDFHSKFLNKGKNSFRFEMILPETIQEATVINGNHDKGNIKVSNYFEATFITNQGPMYYFDEISIQDNYPSTAVHYQNLKLGTQGSQLELDIKLDPHPRVEERCTANVMVTSANVAQVTLKFFLVQDMQIGKYFNADIESAAEVVGVLEYPKQSSFVFIPNSFYTSHQSKYIKSSTTLQVLCGTTILSLPIQIKAARLDKPKELFEKRLAISQNFKFLRRRWLELRKKFSF